MGIGGKCSNSSNIVSTNKLNFNYYDGLNKELEKVWSLESHGTMKPCD